MEQNRRILLFDPLCDLFHRLHRADLIVHIHDGYKDGILADGIFQILQADMAVMIHRQIRHLKALFLQIRQRIVDRGVFDGGADDMITGPFIGYGRPGQRHIVGL